jgi:hypothetical protein
MSIRPAHRTNGEKSAGRCVGSEVGNLQRRGGVRNGDATEAQPRCAGVFPVRINTLI